MKVSSSITCIELTIGRVSLGREQVRLSKRLLSIELVTGSVRLKGEEMKLKLSLVMSAKGHL